MALSCLDTAKLGARAARFNRNKGFTGREPAKGGVHPAVPPQTGQSSRRFSVILRVSLQSAS